MVEVASRVGSCAWRSSRAFRARTGLRPSVRLDRGDTGRDFRVGREDLSELAPERGLALDVGEAVRRGIVLGLIEEGTRGSKRHFVQGVADRCVLQTGRGMAQTRAKV